jgi:PiT family inorganic phosphate transporter
VLIGSGRIVRTVGSGLIQLTIPEAASGQLAEALSVLGAAQVGAPVSSSQVLSSALVGAGGAFRPRHVRWARVRQILMTWVLTFPCAMLFGGALTFITRIFLTEVVHVIQP